MATTTFTIHGNTHFDDVESFLYVLLLFFFSYSSPLPVSELHEADKAGFVEPIGFGRPAHVRNLPKRYADWADGDTMDIADKKHSAISTLDGIQRTIKSAEFLNCLEHNWPKKLHVPISRLIAASFKTFYNSTLCTQAKGSHTEVSHTEFVSTLDRWLSMYAHLEEEFSSCPF